MASFKAYAKENNLTQEAAQKFADLGAQAVKTHIDTALAQVADLRKQWGEDAKADKEFGGDKFDENMATVQKARSAFGSPELDKLLEDTGLGQHPEVLRVFFKVGKAVSEDRLVAGALRPNAQAGAQKFYAASNMNP